MKFNPIVLLIGVITLGACTRTPVTTPEPPTVAASARASVPTPPPAAPTATETAIETGPREVAFETDDGITLSGTLFGDGAVAVVLSHMYPADQTSWHAFAQTLADYGYLALAYDFRGYGRSGGSREVAKIDHDVRAAIAFLRQRDVRRIVLIGASMGGTASAKVARSAGVDGLVVVSGPQSFQGLTVAADDLNLAGMPSLWISSQADPVTRDVEAMRDGATEPKSLHIYDGTAHGTDIFDTANGADLSQRILDFLAAISR